MAPSTTMASAAMASLRRPAAAAAAVTVRMPAATRGYAAQISRSRVERSMAQHERANMRAGTKEQTMSQMQKAAAAEVFKDGGGPLFPGTFVPLPLSAVPKSPADFLRYNYWRLLARFRCYVSLLTVKLQSMSSWRKRPLFQARLRQAAPTANALYREMLEAFAAGDKRALARICLPSFAKQLNAVIDKRSPKEEVRFEFVKPTRRLVYPRVLSYMIHPVNPHDKTRLSEQAIVAVSGQQQLARHVKATGEIVPGTLRVQDKIEYVVLARETQSGDYKSGAWRIWGTVGATTPQQYIESQAVIEKETAARAGWKEKSEVEKPKAK